MINKGKKREMFWYSVAISQRPCTEKNELHSTRPYFFFLSYQSFFPIFFSFLKTLLKKNVKRKNKTSFFHHLAIVYRSHHQKPTKNLTPKKRRKKTTSFNILPPYKSTTHFLLSDVKSTHKWPSIYAFNQDLSFTFLFSLSNFPLLNFICSFPFQGNNPNHPNPHNLPT